MSPVATALVAAVIGAITIEWLRSPERTAGDQALALVFYTGIAGGVVLVSAAGALDVGLFAFLFGSILTVTRGDLVLIAVLGGAAWPRSRSSTGRWRRPSSTRRARGSPGVPIGALNVVVAVLTALTVALSMRIVGILLIAALMVLPVIAASRIAWSMRSTLLLSIAIGLASVLGG